MTHQPAHRETVVPPHAAEGGTQLIDRRRILALAAGVGVAGASLAFQPARRAHATAASVESTEFVVLGGAGTGRRAHFYTDLAAMNADSSIGAASEFFSRDGLHLLPVYNSQGRLVALHDSGDGADPQLVVAKLSGVVGNIEQAILDDPGLCEQLGVSLETALATLPRLDGADLDEAFTLCAPIFGHSDSGAASMLDPGSVWHVIVVHGLG